MQYLDLIPRDECTGCGLCKSICPKQAIDFLEDEEGYLFPQVDNEKCIQCGLCEKHCPVKQDVKSGCKPLSGYSFYLNDKKTLMESASGGAVTALAEAVFQNNGCVYACSYEEGCYDAAFSLCSTTGEFRKYKSSIYFNTQPMDQKSIRAAVESGKLCMAVGLPCQIAALRSYVGKNDNLLCVSLICGGQEPRILHRRVLDEILMSHPSEEIEKVNYRFKKKNWNVTTLRVDFKSGKSNLGGGFFRMEILRECCYKCRYKLDNSFADILVGDFWGSEMLGKEFHNEFGTSVALALTETGKEWMEKTAACGTLQEVPVSAAYKTNTAIIKSKKRTPGRDRILSLMKEKTLSETQKEILGKKGYLFRKIKANIKDALPDSLVRVAKRIKHR